MDDNGWNSWEGKKVFIETRSNRQFSGIVTKVNSSDNPPLVWITIIDKFGNQVSFVHSEIILIKEEK